MSIFDRWRKSYETKFSLAIFITVALLIEAIIGIQYLYAQKSIRKEMKHRAQTELKVKSLEIQGVLNAIEVAAKNQAWNVERLLAYPDSMYKVTERLVTQDELIIGVGVLFVPNYYPSKGYWYEPYVRDEGTGYIEKQQLGGKNHDYTKTDFFNIPLQGDSAFWSEPYLDNDGARTMVITYCYPIHDKNGKVVAILGTDVSLDWLGELMNASPAYPSSTNMILSRTGQVMACPVESLVMKSTIMEVTANMKDTTVRNLNKRMLSGYTGSATVTNNEGEKQYVFYAPIKGSTGWSMAVTCPGKEIYQGLSKMRHNLQLMSLLGFLLLLYIITRTVKNFNHVQEVNKEKERIDSELHIANGIQMGMLPTSFVFTPARSDVDIYGSLVPAKAVGGDLYDFYVRDEKLFFCIGDVSGKGVPAALVMAVIRSSFRTSSMMESTPDRILSQINDSVSDINDENMFATLLVGTLDLPTGRLHYSNAGHCPPLLIGSGVGYLPLDANIPVGLLKGWRYNAQYVMIEPQTTLFLYTDGLTEAEKEDYEQFGKDRMFETAETLLEKGQHSPKQTIERMTEAVNRFVGDNEKSDDLTMLAIQYTKEALDIQMERHLTLENNLDSIPQLNEFVDGISEELDFDMSTTMKLNLAIEEAVVNIINYAYPEGTKGFVNIDASSNDVRLKFVITDEGTPFDPTTRKEVDTTLPVEERPIGGLGILLVRKLMDSINYERIDGKNVLTLRKNLIKD